MVFEIDWSYLVKVQCISDTHGLEFPADTSVDLVLHAGDLTSRGTRDEFMSALRHIRAAWPDEVRIVSTIGNHDVWASEYSGDAYKAAFDAGIDLLIDGMIDEPDFPVIWGCPWSRKVGHWSLGYTPRTERYIFQMIPDDTDVVLVHGPPYGYGDRLRWPRVGEDPNNGSKELVARCKIVKPKLVVCGHIHEGRGQYSMVHEDSTETMVINAATLTEQYMPHFDPIVIELDTE